MKVCDLALFAPGTSSGVKTYITAKIEYVRAHEGIEHVVIVPGEREKVATEGRTKVITVRGVRTFYPGLRIALNFRKVAALVEAEAPDVIELNCQYTLPWAAFLATRRRPTPVVAVYHTDVPSCVRHLARGAGSAVASGLERLTAFYEGLIYRHCDLTIVLNPGMAENVRRLGVQHVRCLPCGADTTRFSPAARDARFRERLGIRPGQKAIIYAGRLSAEKELDVLFAALDFLPTGEFVLLIAGDGPDASDVSRRAAAHAAVRYLGHVDGREDLATAYASSDLFAMPGRYETFGMSTLEALSCGLPVVGIDDSGTASLVPPSLGRMARPGDARGLAGAIETVAAWPAEPLREACHAYADASYSWPCVLDRYFDVYRELIDSARREPACA